MTVFIKKDFDLAPVCEREVLRYGGAKGSPDAMSIIEGCQVECKPAVCYTIVDLKIRGEVCDFGAFEASSSNLAKNLSGCKRALIFCATVGIEYDRAITSLTRLSPAKALMVSALGSERIEALCDSFCKTVSLELGTGHTPRFSPGYGDLDLQVQKEIFALLEPHRRIGVSLGAGMIMTPSKSVTAFVGLLEK